MLINEFNKTIMKNFIDVIIDYKTQLIIMICSLLNFYEYVVDVMVYGRDTLP